MLRKFTSIVSIVVAAITTWLPSTLIAAAFWILVCDRILGLSLIIGLLLSFVVFNLWYWGGHILSGILLVDAIQRDSEIEVHTMDFYTKSDIDSSFHRIDELLGCGIFDPNRNDDPLVRSALTELLILVRDLMAKAEIYAEPINFTDDINIKDNVQDVSGAIKFVRDAVCHVDSEKHNHDMCNARLKFNIAWGKGPFMKFGEVEIKSDYEDDVCFFFGHQKLYLNRHLKRAYLEAKDKLLPLVSARSTATEPTAVP